MNNISLNSKQLESICDALVESGKIVLTDFLSEALTTALYQHVTQLADSDFNDAAIGRQTDLQLNQDIRNDKTRWLTQDSAAEQGYLAIMEQLRQYLNQQLFLGLNEYESHFAHYGVGNYYHQHVDAFKGHSNRVVTSVFYLNPDWEKSDGGELVIYNPDDNTQEIQRISPAFGTLVLFMSERFPHEVLVAHRERYSISGWFRIDKPLLS